MKHTPFYRRGSRRSCPEDLWDRFPCSGCTSCLLDWTRNCDISPRKSIPNSTWGLRWLFHRGESNCHDQELTCFGCNYPSSWILCLQHCPLSAQKNDHSQDGYPTMAEDMQKRQRGRGGKENAWLQSMWSAWGSMRVWHWTDQQTLCVGFWNTCHTKDIKISFVQNFMAFSALIT